MKKIIIGLVVILGIFSIVVLVQPDDFEISRSTTIKAPVEKVFPHVNKLANWHAWSPWVELDPNAEVTFAGPVEGKDASMTWKGNDQMGEGTLTIIETKTNELVRYRLDFVKPMIDTAMSKFEFKSEANDTLVVWTMYGKNDNFIKKAMWMVFCSKMLGKEFEKGLANMKTVIETNP